MLRCCKTVMVLRSYCRVLGVVHVEVGDTLHRHMAGLCSCVIFIAIFMASCICLGFVLRCWLHLCSHRVMFFCRLRNAFWLPLSPA